MIKSDIFTPFTSPVGGWMQIVQPGQYPHEKGLQTITAATIEALIARWKADGMRPILVDVDHAILNKAATAPAYGWIEDVEVRDGWLCGRVRWTDIGSEAVTGGRYRMLSPVWAYRKALTGIEPTRLHSVSLTNDPNIGGPVVINRAPEDKDLPEEGAQGAAQTEAAEPLQTQPITNMPPEDIKRIAVALGLPETATVDDIVAAIEAKSAVTTELETEVAENRRREGADLAAKYGISGAARDQFVEKYAANRATARELLTFIEPSAKVVPQGITQRNPGREPLAANRSSANEAERDQLVASIQASKQCGFRQAWDLAREQKPELFS